jgi:hypothetical protein
MPMNLIVRLLVRSAFAPVMAAVGTAAPGWAAETRVVIDCFHDPDLPLLSRDGVRTGKTLEVPAVGEGLPAMHDSRGLLHFKIDNETFTVSESMAKLKEKPQALTTSPPVGGQPMQSFVTKGPATGSASSLCADRIK